MLSEKLADISGNEWRKAQEEDDELKLYLQNLENGKDISPSIKGIKGVQGILCYSK